MTMTKTHTKTNTKTKTKTNTKCLKDPSHAVIDERPKSPIEKRKRNLIFFSPISRRERET